MSKRFTDSEKFSDVWYRKLKPKHKCLWEYFLSKCDIAGIIELDFESMSFHIGEEVTQEDLGDFQDKIVFIDETKIFIPNFIKFQQGELNENNPAHKNIIKKLQALEIDLTIDIKELQSTFQGASKPLSRDIGIVKYSNGISKKENNVQKKLFKEMIEIWNEICTNLPKSTLYVNSRNKKLNSLIGNKEIKDEEGKPLFEDIEDWKCFCEMIQASNWLARDWGKCSIDWVLKPANMIKIYEGNYGNKK